MTQNILYKTLLSVGKVKDITLRGRCRWQGSIKMYLKKHDIMMWASLLLWAFGLPKRYVISRLAKRHSDYDGFCEEVY